MNKQNLKQFIQDQVGTIKGVIIIGAVDKYVSDLLSDYTNKIVENAEIKNTGFIGEDGWVDSQEIDKESITNQLDLFLKTII